MRWSALIFLFCLYETMAQKVVDLHFVPQWKEHDILLGNSYVLNESDSVTFNVIKWYISGINLYNGNNLVFTEPNSYHLMDVEDPASMIIHLEIPSNSRYDRVSFLVGVDSLTQSSGVKGGDLDPTKGMYWTWQSGYIGIKVEGISNVCKTRKNEFMLHVGGFIFPNASQQNVFLALTDGATKYNIDIDFGQFISLVDLSKTNHIMSPSSQAVEVAKTFSSSFTSISGI